MPTDVEARQHLIASDRLERLAAAMDVWDFNAFDTWRPTIWRLMEDVLDARVCREFERHPPEYLVGDDLSWLDAIIADATGAHTDIKTMAADRIARHFRAFRTCHATRTADVEAFYRDGLRPLDPQTAHTRAAKIFLGGQFPELSQDDLDQAIRAVGTDTREGRVYFDANERALIDHAGHYLLYGGEYLVAIAAHLPRYRDYRQCLKAFGAPTLFVCDVPFASMHSYTLLEFAGVALEYMFERLADDDFEPERFRGAGFSIRRPLPPEYIVGHYHPTCIRDPFLGYAVLAEPAPAGPQ